MKNPLKSPNAPHTSTDSRTASGMLAGLALSTAPQMTLDTAMREPMDKSMPATQMTKVMPMARIPFTDICCSTLTAFCRVRKVGFGHQQQHDHGHQNDDDPGTF